MVPAFRRLLSLFSPVSAAIDGVVDSPGCEHTECEGTATCCASQEHGAISCIWRFVLTAVRRNALVFAFHIMDAVRVAAAVRFHALRLR